MQERTLFKIISLLCLLLIKNAECQVITDNLYINETQHAEYLKQMKADMQQPFSRFTGNRDTLTIPFFDDFARNDVTWKPFRSGTTTDLNGVHMINNKTGFAVGNSGTLLRTGDRGRSWQAIDLGLEENLYKIQFINPLTGFIVGQNGLFIKTTDGGLNWQNSIVPGAEDLYALRFISANRGFVAGRAGLIFTTIDGGQTWIPISNTRSANINSIREFSNNVLYIAGDSGVIMRYNLVNGTLDAPGTGVSPRANIMDMDATSDGRIIAVGSRGSILINFMGDNAWFQADPNRQDSSSFFRCVRFFGNNDAWIVGDSGTVLTSATRGWSWERIVYPSKFNLRSLSLTTADKGIVVGATGLILSSEKDHGRPFSRHWKSNSAVYINNTHCVNPPTVNAATFDGLDIAGLPYARAQPGVIFIPDQYGGCDTLTSLPIDLDGMSELDNVAFSYYWQAGGRALQLFPDSIDFLFIQFKNAAEEWITVDSIQGGQSTIKPFAYRQLFLQQQFLHRGFQFRFFNVGNRTGNFDLWHVDMIYLDNFRAPFDTCFNDVSFYPIENTLFKTYSAIPYEHLKYMIEQGRPFLNDNVKTYARNFKSAGLVNVTGDFTVVEDKSGDEVQYLNISSQDEDFEGFGFPLLSCGIPPDDPVLQQTTYHRPVTVNNLSAKEQAFAPLAAPTTLRYRFSIRDQDQFNTYFYNDTTSKTVRILDDYAYDDGTAELSRGVGGNNSRAAIRFFVEKTDTLTDISLNFQRTPFALDRTISFNLMAWEGIEEFGNTEKVLFRRLVILPPTDSVNQIFTFSLRNLPLSVRILEGGKHYFFGWQQGLTENANEVRIGVDVNTETDTIFYYNTGSTWFKYRGDAFALIFRPVFGREVPTSVKPTISAHQKFLYPNPSKGLLKIAEEVQQIQIFDLRGKLLLDKTIEHNSERVLTYHPGNKGIYLAHIKHKSGQIFVQKLIFE
jgi:photosystem II stability/assembly factor-like uncharacterized protein